ncbi:hypothetical protein PHYBLDRAFT_167122 [Phycomyces blakesleeanus NRRL 1555(-)]|uniref:Uncharacterized protein n=1 Tax=Phycomyces blakesleeanus (strain ATCC 8743b / DSM 1359 / FGSC 10004 / NBRC 33097 / NRRL 1555) TaxID=763407 RepID=A0A162PPJ1_PHYB8|nr:hypothetical protein PHYBLDRAFT_167122 [Phycomyces blakesleeanus NRRL 1555(-)]OAD74777.1 hypothetical protein PHYBLDRAFT_167122 [Phycomyces blakesleeanus NRRL 1555(-)]|eukprot:XP_018292817.1 hypothetical protein PHYBLDRAFT_167122 [Phycomyces blakesleeanus NRRL 1555(-)]
MILIYKADFIINKRIIKNYFYHYETPLVTRTGLHLEPEVLPEGQEDHVYNLWLEREQERTIDLDTKFGDKVKHLPESTKPSLDDKPFLLLLVAFELRLNKRYLPVRTPIQFKLESSSKM